MTKEEKKEWLEAIKNLREHYKKYKLDEIPPGERACPLCRIARGHCPNCLWEMFEESVCFYSPYYLHSTKERLARLDRWEEKLLK